MQELEHVLVGNHIIGLRGQFAEQVIYNGLTQLLERAGQVLRILGRIGEFERPIASAHLIDRCRKQRVESQRHEQFETIDAGELEQCLRRREPRLVQDRPDLGVDLLRHPARLQIMTDDGVEARLRRQRSWRYFQTFG